MKTAPALWMIFLAALVVRLATVVWVVPALNPDTNPDYYRELGRNILAGKGYVATARDGRELPNINRPPAYPVFLAGVMAVAGDRLMAIAVANCILAAAGCALVVGWALRWLRPGAAMAAGWIVVFEPNMVLRCAAPMVEPLFVLWVLLGAVLLTWRADRTWGCAAAGVCWGLAALTRVVAIWLWPVALVALVLEPGTWPQRARRVLVFVAAFTVLPAVWMARNEAVTGRWMFSTSGRFYMVSSWSASWEAHRTGISVEEAQQRVWNRTGVMEFCESPEAFEKMWENQDALVREVREVAPLWLALHSAKGAGQTLLGPGRRTLDSMSQHPPRAPRWWTPVYMAGLAALMALAAWGTWRWWKPLWLVAVLAGYFVVLTAGPFGNSRFRYPVMPMLAILAVAGMTRLKEDSCPKTSS